MTEPQTEPITDMNSETQLLLPKMLVLLLLAIPLVIAWAAFLVRPDIALTSLGAIFVTGVFVVCILLPDRTRDPQVVDMEKKGLAIVEFRGRRRDFPWEDIAELRCRHNLGRRQGLDGYIRLRIGKNKVEINNSFPALDRMIDFAARACREKGVSFADESVPASVSDEYHPPSMRFRRWLAAALGVSLLVLSVLVFQESVFFAILCWIAVMVIVGIVLFVAPAAETSRWELQTIEVNERGISATTCGTDVLCADWSDVLEATIDPVCGRVHVKAETVAFRIPFYRFKKSLEIADVVTDYCLKKGIKLDHSRYGKFNYPE
jgi:hypothetical protein